MALLYPPQPTMYNHAKCMRRTATSVMAGAFDIRPPRDVLTSLLNGVAPYKAVEKNEESRRGRKKEKRERERERRRQRTAPKARQKEPIPSTFDDISAEVLDAPIASTSSAQNAQPPSAPASSYWRVRPSIHIATMQRSVSVTPPPITPPAPAASASTPAPSSSIATSRKSSKRPRSPELEEQIEEPPTPPPPSSRPRKKRVAVRKGWKGWIEGSPPPSNRLINLDKDPLVLQGRKTRSGKCFAAVGSGNEG
ncbi:hypothetical protein AX17_002513 [Amanita inopinata Kibby_2008]|nr:hypothetical protein AX17_002513 [Amanita inopinata Kibby_2008]